MGATMIITKGASSDGSMMVTHSDDDELIGPADNPGH